MPNIAPYFKGTLLCLLIAAAAWGLGRLCPVVGGPVFAIGLGLLTALFLKDRSGFQMGINFSARKILQYAVILLGFGLNLSVVLEIGWRSLPIIVSTIAVALAVAYLTAKILRLPGKTATLIGVGSAICGGSAIAATAPVIGAGDDDIAQSVAVIFFFNVAAALIFPALGGLLGFSTDSGQAFGLFAGTAINDTSSVTAAAATWDALHHLGSATLDMAVTVKLTRTLAIIPLTLGLAFYLSARSGPRMGPSAAASSHARNASSGNGPQSSPSLPRTGPNAAASSHDRSASSGNGPQSSPSLNEEGGRQVALKEIFPFFIFWFLAASLATTVASGLGLPAEAFAVFKGLSKFFIIMAMGAIGLNTNLVRLIKSGGRPLLMGLICWLSITGSSLLAQRLLGLW